jgi:hypothetical protein
MSEPSANTGFRIPRRHERRRDAGDPFLYGETVLLQNADDVAVRLELLKAELCEAEDGVDHLLAELLHRLHVRDSSLLQFLYARVVLGSPFGLALGRPFDGAAGAAPAPAAPPRLPPQTSERPSSVVSYHLRVDNKITDRPPALADAVATARKRRQPVRTSQRLS